MTIPDAALAIAPHTAPPIITQRDATVPEEQDGVPQFVIITLTGGIVRSPGI